MTTLIQTPELTLARLTARMARKMGWPSSKQWPAEIEPTVVANETGEWLLNAYPWEWLTRPPGTLDLVTGQGWLDLAADFGAIVGKPRGAVSAGYTLKMETMEDVNNARSDIPPGGQVFTGCIGHTGPTQAGPKPVPILAIGPVPSLSKVAAFNYVYRAGWVYVGQSSDHILVPSWMVGLYVVACCEYIGGWEHDGEAGVLERQDMIRKSSAFDGLIERDSSIQEDLGRMRGGVGETFARSDDMQDSRVYDAPTILPGH